MRTLLLILTLITITAASAICAETPAAGKTEFVAMVAPQARVNVDAQGIVLSIFNTTDGSGNKPAILNIYYGDVKITVTPAIQANLDKLSPSLDWKKGGIIYTLQVAPATIPPAQSVQPKTNIQLLRIAGSSIRYRLSSLTPLPSAN